MTFYQGLAVTLLKVWSAIVMVEGAYRAIALTMNWAFLGAEGSKHYLLLSVISALLFLATGIALWFAAEPLGKSIGCRVRPEPRIEIDVDALAVLGVFLVGVYFLTSKTPQAVSQTVAIFHQTNARPDAARFNGPTVVSGYEWAKFVSAWSSVIIALFITAKPRGVARMFGWLRSAGQRAPDSEKDAES